jgi:hypothetical protein
MWDLPMPRPKEPGAGFPVLERAVHTTIWAPTRAQGAYNHHPRLALRDSRFHAIFSNHPHGEDGPGQRVLYATSPDGLEWTTPVELIPPPDEIRLNELQGLVCTAFDWRWSGDRLFALIGLNRNIGFTDPNGTAVVAERDTVYYQRARKGYTCLTREVLADGSFGPIMHFGGELPEDMRFDSTRLPDDLASQLQSTPCRVPPWDFEGWLGFPAAVDGRRLCEPTVYRTRAGAWRMVLRDKVYSHRMFLSEFDETSQTWPPARPTDIPDSPSLTDAVELPDGTVLLIGNQTAAAFDNPDQVGHYPRDPLTVSVSSDGGYHFARVYALRCGVQAYRTPQSVVKGRGGGGQYPSALVHDGRLYVIYSMGKEDIAISQVALADIGL